MRSLWKFCVTLLLLAACVPGKTTTPTAEPTLPPPPTVTPAPTATAEPVVTGPWWNDTVFYEIFVRSFKDSDGDGIGDFNGITEQLDYLQELGVTGLWLMPIHPAATYHGYDVLDYYAVSPDFGTMADFKNLLAKAHARNIRVLIDLVLNHTAYTHPWFKAALKSDPNYREWYIWSDADPNTTGPWNQKVWYKSPNGYYFAIFWDRMPDLNYDNPAVRDEAKKIAEFWLTDVGVDGFRLDAVRYLVEEDKRMADSPGTHAFLAEWGEYARGLHPEAFTVGEAWTDNGNVSKYTKTDAELDSAFNFDFADAILTALSEGSTTLLNFQLKATLQFFPQSDNANFLTNHDIARVMTQLSGAEDVKLAKAKAAAVILLTAPGIPFIYYGEEIGMTGPKPDERIRTPMQWTADTHGGFTTGTAWAAVNNDYKRVNVAAQTGQADSLLEHYRALIALRNAHAALRSGETLVLDSGAKRLYAILRYDEQAAFLVLVNVSSKSLAADTYSLTLETGPFTGPLNVVSALGLDDPAAPELNASGGFNGYVPFQEIPAYSTAIIQLTP
jgi:glycosidase